MTSTKTVRRVATLDGVDPVTEVALAEAVPSSPRSDDVNHSGVGDDADGTTRGAFVVVPRDAAVAASDVVRQYQFLQDHDPEGTFFDAPSSRADHLAAACCGAGGAPGLEEVVTIPIPGARLEAIELVARYIEASHVDERREPTFPLVDDLEGSLGERDLEFLVAHGVVSPSRDSVAIVTVIEAVCVADYLGIAALVKVLSCCIAATVSGCEPSEIRSMFGIENDLTPGQLASLAFEKQWCLRGARRGGSASTETSPVDNRPRRRSREPTADEAEARSSGSQTLRLPTNVLNHVVRAAATSARALLTLREVSRGFEAAVRKAFDLWIHDPAAPARPFARLRGCVEDYARIVVIFHSQELTGKVGDVRACSADDLVQLVMHGLRFSPAPGSLDLAGGSISDTMLAQLADRLPEVVRLNLSGCFPVASLGPFAERLEALDISGTTCTVGDTALHTISRLRELNASENANVTSLQSFAPTLVKLGAAGKSCGLTDASLVPLSALVDLSASFNPNVTTIEPFANTLTSLDASGACGIADAGLRHASVLKTLRVCYNPRVTTVEPFAKTLRVLDASEECGISSEGLESATALTELDASYNPKIDSLLPFLRTIRKLGAAGCCGISDIAMMFVPNLEELNVSFNRRVQTVDGFSDTLTKLDASGPCGINDEGLASATKIVELNMRDNEGITSVSPFASRLRRLDASGSSCGLDDNGVANATALEELCATGNSKLTTISPFAESLVALEAVGESGITEGALRAASALRQLNVSCNAGVSEVESVSAVIMSA